MILYDIPIKIELREDQLFVNEELHKRAVRTLFVMREVLINKEVQMNNDTQLYYMFREVYVNNGIGYDLVYMPPVMIGVEYNKTYGHYHPEVEKDLSYPEVYQVLKGRALFLLQKKINSGVTEVIYVNAESGEVLLIPPNYGHVSINQSEDSDLVLANLVYNKFESDYDEFKTNRGAAFYYTTGGFVHNTKYVVRKFDRFTAQDLNKKYWFSCSDLLSEFHKAPEKFKFLKIPSLLINK